MKRKPKRHDHLKKLYREELENRAATGQTATLTGNEPATSSVSRDAAVASVMTVAEQRWLRRDLFRSIMVVIVLLAIISLLAVYQNQSSIVGFTAKVAHWGGF